MAEQKERKFIIHELPNGISFKLCWVEGIDFKTDKISKDFLGMNYIESIASFYMCEFPVTQALWIAVMKGQNPSRFQGANRPVEQVSSFEAAAFCNQLNLLSNYPPAYFIDKALQKPLTIDESQKIEYTTTVPIFSKPAPPTFRLLSGAEWEYAARGGKSSGQFTYAGGDKLDEVGWYNDNSHSETKEVGLKLPNELGLYDLSGNIWEWCGDQLKETSTTQELRGGCWSSNPEACHPFGLRVSHPSSRGSDIGFRVALFFPSDSCGAHLTGL